MSRLVLRFCQILANRLPRNRPVVARVVVAQINVMPRPVQRHTVRTKARDPSVLGIFVERISASIVRDHRAQVFDAEIICPRDRHVDAINHILPVFIIKMAVTHEVLQSTARYEFWFFACHHELAPASEGSAVCVARTFLSAHSTSVAARCPGAFAKRDTRNVFLRCHELP